MIWGTTIRVGDATRAFRGFVRGFGTSVPTSSDPRGQLSHYQRVLLELSDSGERFVNVDCHELRHFSSGCKRVFEQLLRYPQEIIPLMDIVMSEELGALLITNATSDAVDAEASGTKVQVRVFNIGESTSMRVLEPRHIDTLVAVQGMIIRASAVIPDMRQGFFRCSNCGNTLRVDNDRGRVDVPPVCPVCSTKGSLDIVHNRCAFNDKQLIKLQVREACSIVLFLLL